MSKAQRGFLLAQDVLHQPQRVQSARLHKDMPVRRVAQHVLRSAFAQFTCNLAWLCVSDDPEVAH